MIEDEGKYYLYRHIRLDTNQVFYVGIGTKCTENFRFEKTEFRRAYAISGRGLFWKKITNKSNYKIEVFIESNDYRFIKEKEIEFINLYGRRDLGTGTLVNHTNGGDGVQGRIISEDERKKISNTLKGRPFKEERKRNISKGLTGITHSPESIQKRVESRKGYTHSEETRNLISKIHTGMKHTEETKKKLSEIKKGKPRNKKSES